ncbi:MAG: uncharacterized protein QOJ65_1612 [Fimbriimonadaceae bacterium]|jgi:uncharacterized protein YfbU (UPF0304 family)|nr:uncharacterized protein [Fimbriimonadaceae bacterium]
MDQLTDGERLILMNQYTILEILTRAFPEIARRGNTIYHDAETYRWYQEIMLHGYHTLVPEAARHLQQNDLSQEDEKEILAVLDMYLDLQTSLDQLDDKGDLNEESVAFEGWDGHRSELGFAEAFCYREASDHVSAEERTPARYPMIKPSPAFDSHFPTMEMYRRMLAAFEPIKRDRLNTGEFQPMTVGEIKTVLGARTPPDHA